MKISEFISKEAQDILNHSHRKQIVLDAEAEIKTRIKEPWEMTAEEYANEGLPAKSLTAPQATIWGLRLTKHEKLVQQALSEGKPVPKEVLADYPDLKEKVEADEKKEKEKKK